MPRRADALPITTTLPWRRSKHLGHHGTHQPVQRMHHDVEHLGPSLIARIGHSHLGVHSRQVGDKHINRTRVVDELMGSAGRSEIPVVIDYFRALLTEYLGDCRPHERGSLGHHHALTFQSFRHHTPPPSCGTCRGIADTCSVVKMQELGGTD